MKKPPLIVALLLLWISPAFALELATSILRDVGFTSKLEYVIDVHIVSNGDAFTLGPTHLTIAYNGSVLSNPALSEQHPDFSNSSYTMALNNAAASQTQLQITPTGATGTVLPDSEIRLARITFTLNNPGYKTQTAGMAWVEAPVSTYVKNMDGDDIFLSVESDLLAGNTTLICLPVIGGTPADTAVVGQLYTFQPDIEDPCGAGAFVFSIYNQPAWADFNDENGRLYGTPAFSDVTTYADIEIGVTDSYGDSTNLAAFDLGVTCPAGPTLGGSPAVSIVAGNVYSFTPTISNGCGAKTFSITNKPVWASFDETTGALTGTPTLIHVGATHDIVIEVSDENSNGDALESFDIEVTPDCTAPIISGTPDASITSGQGYTFTPTVSNGCGTLTFAILNPPSWAEFNSVTGALTGTPEAADADVYADIVIRVTDALNDSDLLAAFSITVIAEGSSGSSSSSSTSSSTSSSSTTSSSGGESGGGGGGGCFIRTIW
jgi:hypothetical protein